MSSKSIVQALDRIASAIDSHKRQEPAPTIVRAEVRRQLNDIVVPMRDALKRAHAALDKEHAHTEETWTDRETWKTAR